MYGIMLFMIVLYEQIFRRVILKYVFHMIYFHNLFFKRITMQCPLCCHVMAFFHEDKQIL